MSIQIGGSGMVLLTITFVILKALEYLDWSWLWVFAPLWLPVALFLGVGILVLIGVILVGGVALIINKFSN